MSSWHVLELYAQPDEEPIPQLLVKPAFTADSYTVYLTCLTNVWSEELDLTGIVNRATEQQSPIEVRKHDTAQLAILLDNVKNSLGSSDEAECRLTREGVDGITLHTTISLPEPLDSLTWRFHLQKRTSVTLKNELILPLLISSHIQYERINDLVTTIENKDKAIARMVDQFEPNNLDFAAAFPSIGGLKAGRKTIKREQAARHIPALRPFQQHAWREETAQLADSDITTLGLFQEALVQCTPVVPLSLKADDGTEDWLSMVPSRLSYIKPAVKIKIKEPEPAFQPPRHGHESSSVDDDTEDELENHENFNIRNPPNRGISDPSRYTAPPAQYNLSVDEDDSTEDDGDLDVPSRNQSQSQTQAQNRIPRQTQQRTKSPHPKPPSEPATSPPPVTRPKGKVFRIGGKAKKNTPETSQQDPVSQDEEAIHSLMPSPPPQADWQPDLQVGASSKKDKKPFRIGGKYKDNHKPDPSQRDLVAPQATDRFMDAHPLTMESSPPPMPRSEKEYAHKKEEHVETSEEKAERKRAELKRRNEEIAKKQTQHKRKKRF